jgi:ppGpp synthetase/RelA/SpoT-type nucleotidyltranferase
VASQYKFLAEDLRRDIEGTIARVALLCRVFARGKSNNSLEEKLSRKPGKYSVGKKLVQDAIGVRVVCYFPDDLDVVRDLLCANYTFDQTSSTIDVPQTDQFSVTRFNLIFRLPEQYERDFHRASGNLPVDLSFEVQLRTVLSEGWHEVEHDLRYKSKEHWEGQPDLSRALNSIVASLEMSEWSMGKIFNELAYRHYRRRNWAAMLHNKLRLRVAPLLSKPILDLLDQDSDLAKLAFRINRSKVIATLFAASPRIPVTMDNLVFVWNSIEIRDARLTELTPMLLREALDVGIGKPELLADSTLDEASRSARAACSDGAPSLQRT